MNVALYKKEILSPCLKYTYFVAESVAQRWAGSFATEHCLDWLSLPLFSHWAFPISSYHDWIVVLWAKPLGMDTGHCLIPKALIDRSTVAHKI